MKTDFLVNFRQIIVSNVMYLPVITTFCFCYVRIFLLAFLCCQFLPTAKNFYFFHEICLLAFAVLLQKEIFNHGISVSLTVSLFTFQHSTIQWIGFFLTCRAAHFMNQIYNVAKKLCMKFNQNIRYISIYARNNMICF